MIKCQQSQKYQIFQKIDLKLKTMAKQWEIGMLEWNIMSLMALCIIFRFQILNFLNNFFKFFSIKYLNTCHKRYSGIQKDQLNQVTQIPALN